MIIGSWTQGTDRREELNFSLTAGWPRVGSRKRMIAASRFGSARLMFRVPARGKDFSVRWDHI